MRGTVGTQEGFRGTERDQGHSWYTGGASEVRNGIRGKLVQGGTSEVRNGVRGTVGTREGLLRYGTG